MKLRFTKMTGAGNDFVVIASKKFQPEPELIRRLCDRHFGIGADGLIIISKSKNVDFNIRYFNSDGTGDVLCINGARCAVMFAYLNGLCKRTSRFEFINKIFNARVGDKENVQIFLNYNPVLRLNLKVVIGKLVLPCHFVDIGASHLIVKWEKFKSIMKKSDKINDLSGFIDSSSYFDDFNIELIGRKFRYHEIFSPEGVNVNFIEKVGDRKFKIRTYERGVEGETLACGSGSISAAIVMNILDKIQPPITFITKSKKELTVNFEKVDNKFEKISITGHAVVIFEGTISL